MEGQIKIISYNVLVDWCIQYTGSNTGITKFYDYPSRIQKITRLLADEQADSFGVQECSLPIKQAILGALPQYGCAGVMDTGGPDTPNAFGTFIFYNRGKYRLLESENFWLSETPDVPSGYPGSDRPRNGVWVILENLETGARYAHVNVHLEWKTQEANSYGAKYTRKMIEMLAARDLPVFCTGDFNIESDTYHTIEIMTGKGAVSVQDAQLIAARATPAAGTHIDVLNWKLDYCFVTDQTIKVSEFSLLGDDSMSDHFAVKIIAALQ